MDTRKIISSAVAGVLIVTPLFQYAYADDMADVQAALQTIQTTDAGLPSGITRPKGAIGDIFGKIFYQYNDANVTLRGKIKTQYLDVPSVATAVKSPTNGTQNYISKYIDNGTNIGISSIFDNGTNVGIGSSSPATKLEVNGDLGFTSNAQYLKFKTTTASTRVLGINSSNDLYIGSIDTANNAMIFMNNAAERMRIDSNGNVGIGTASPENSEGWSKVLDVFALGHSKIQVTTGNIKTGLFSHDSGFYSAPAGGMVGTRTNHPFSIITNSTSRLIVDATGNVGIGTTTPTYQLSLAGGNGGTLKMGFTNTTPSTGRTYSLNSNQDGNFFIGDETAGINRLTITPAGNVGIGTTSPSVKLHIADATSARISFEKTGASANISAIYNDGNFNINAGSGPLWLRGASDVLINPTTGNVGIGTTTPSQKLTVADTLAITNAGNVQSLLLGNQDSAGANNPAIISGANGELYFGGGNSWTGNGGTKDYAMKINDNGNVGIGTTTPSYKLHVAGDMYTTGRLKTSAFTQGDFYDIEGARIGASSLIYSYGPICTGNASSGCDGANGVTLSTAAVPGSPIVGISSAGNSWFNGGNVGIGTTTPYSKLQVEGDIIASNLAGANLLQGGSNLTDSAWGGLTTLVQDTFVDGSSTKVLESTSDGNAGNCYQWGMYQKRIRVNPDKKYEFSLWMRQKIGTTGSKYLGFYVYDSSGAQITGAWNNPYFWTSGSVGSSWKRISGFLEPQSATDANSDGMSDIQSTRTNGNEWRFPSNAAYAMIRFGYCYDGTAGNKVQFAYPSVVEINPDNEGDGIIYTDANSSRVGINTAAPTEALEVNGNLKVSGTISGVLSSTLNAANISAGTFGSNTGFGNYTFNANMQTNGNLYMAGGLFSSNSSSNPLRFAINDAEKMRIDANGNVGIGTTNPDAKLDIFNNSGNATNLILAANYENAHRWRMNTVDRGAAIDLDFTSSDGADTQETVLQLTRSNSGRPEFAVQTNQLVVNNGNVGIGTTSPSAKLDIGGGTASSAQAFLTTGIGDANFRLAALNGGASNTSGSEQSWLGLYYAGTGKSTGISFMRGGGATDGSMAFQTNATERLRIDNTGNVGIGTASPTSKLQVAGETRIDGGDLVLNNAAGQLAHRIKSYASGTSLWMISPAVNTPLRLTLADSHDWDRTADIAYTPGTSGAAGGILTIGQLSKNSATWTHGITALYTNGTERMRVDNAGNVGIGTTAPTEKLEVNGNVKATAFYYTSDERLKKNIKTISNALDLVNKLRGVSFNWKKDNAPQIGFIAQEVEKVIPDAVKTGSDGYKSVEYGNIVAPVVEAIKELSRKIDELFAKYLDQQKKIDGLQKQIDEIRASLKK